MKIYRTVKPPGTPGGFSVEYLYVSGPIPWSLLDHVIWYGIKTVVANGDSEYYDPINEWVVIVNTNGVIYNSHRKINGQ